MEEHGEVWGVARGWAGPDCHQICVLIVILAEKNIKKCLFETPFLQDQNSSYMLLEGGYSTPEKTESWRDKLQLKSLECKSCIKLSERKPQKMVVNYS